MGKSGCLRIEWTRALSSRLIVDNEEAEIKMPSPPRLSFAGGTLVLENMAPATVQKVFGPEPWVWDSRVGAWRCDAVEYLAVRRALGNGGFAYENTVPEWSRIHWPTVQLPTLRPEQSDAVAAWKGAAGDRWLLDSGVSEGQVPNLAGVRGEPDTPCRCRTRRKPNSGVTASHHLFQIGIKARKGAGAIASGKMTKLESRL